MSSTSSPHSTTPLLTPSASAPGISPPLTGPGASKSSTSFGRRNDPLPPIPIQNPGGAVDTGGLGGPTTPEQSSTVPGGASGPSNATAPPVAPGPSNATAPPVAPGPSNATGPPVAPGPSNATGSVVTVPDTTPAQGGSTAREGSESAPHGTSGPPPAPPSPSKPVAGRKHGVKRQEEFMNEKSSKLAKGTSALPLHLKNTPKKKRPIGPVVEVPVPGADPWLLRWPWASRSGSDREPSNRAPTRPTRPLRPLRLPPIMPSPSHLPPVYSNGPQAVEQQVMAQQQVMHQPAMAQPQVMPPQQLFQQPQMYPPFMQVPQPMAYPVPMQPQSAVMGYHTFPQPMPPQPAQTLNTSIWDDYRDGRRGDAEAQQYSTPRRKRTRHVHYDLSDEDDDEEEVEMQEDPNDEDEDIADDYNEDAYEGGPEDEEEMNEEESNEGPWDDGMEDVETHPGDAATDGPSTPRPGAGPSHIPTDRAAREPVWEIHTDSEHEQVRGKGKERARTPVPSMPPSTRPTASRASRTPQPDRVLPRAEGGSFFLLLLEQFTQFNEIQREENRLNRQWQ
uniref:Global transcription regulator sge1 n=1 Tax=Ganoderma boninense TaxID=34458 RepID=A0A5K1JRA4_9APHY|nr:Global transcription regulator sge1 [Ganoderma boninense]